MPGFVASVEQQFTLWFGHSALLWGLVGGLVIAGMNMFGALLVFVWENPSQRALDGALGFAAGVMLSASFTSLILPGIELAGGNLFPVIVGFFAGVALLDRADAWVPHVHVAITGKQRLEGRGDDARVASVLLFIVAITLHNMPEGLAVGVGFGSAAIHPGATVDGQSALGNAISLMLAIGIQNIPEGLAVSIAAINAGLGKRFYAAFAGIRAGLVEIPLALFGALAVSMAEPILPYAMGFAAGGMLFVISDEIMPETHARGNERIATLGTMVGVMLMLSLDVALG
ncbi:ZIP family metal transporter [Haloarchaeobius sp. DYHT-AS-18]|uniref:ZIP family metal transporter n=1 Tax=Haloarchaeobius sp. DYHT-AS-18 TaxID=3446117 RepID=UPI003EB9C69D